MTMEKTIAVDVDGTLLIRGKANSKLIDWLRKKKSDGFDLVLWSARGEEHARRVSERFEISELFTVILSKPGHIVDDKGWNWVRFTKLIRRFSK